MQIVINSPGTYLNQKDGCFRLRQKEKHFDVSPRKVESIVIANQASISTQAVVLALEHNIDVIFLDGYGDPVGRIWFSKLGSTALIRRKQLAAAETRLGLELVLDMVSQKLDNQIGFLKKLKNARPGKEDLFSLPLRSMETIRSGMELGDGNLDGTRDRLRGMEGSAGRAYFGCLSTLMPEKYRFQGRSKRPAQDPFNAVLNYGYGILYSRVEKACILAGLDPYVGFMHTDNYNKKSLVFDLIEPFRIFAEQPTVHLFTGRKIKDEYFDAQENAVSLNSKGKPAVVEAVNTFLEETVRYRRRNVKRKHIIQHEAHRLANLLLAEEGVRRPDWMEIKEF